MPSRRCEMGCESWPDSDLYNFCLSCGEATTRIKQSPTLTDEEARSRTLHALFEEHYAWRCAQIGVEPDGPIPPADEVHQLCLEAGIVAC